MTARALLRSAPARFALATLALGPLRAVAAPPSAPAPHAVSSSPASMRPSAGARPAAAGARPADAEAAAGATAPDPLEAAERAYEKVDFATQLEQATRALEAGHRDPATLANIYRLLGIAHAALGSSDAAKQAFMRLLALDPAVALEHVLSPRLRTPYMEARGFWDVSRSRLALGVDWDATGHALELTLSDPLQMGHRVRVTSVAPEAREVAMLSAAPRLNVDAGALEPHAGTPLRVELLDPYDNVVLARVITPPPAPEPRAGGSQRAATEPATSNEESAPSALPLVFGGGALLGLGVGVTAHIIRENRAQEWNGVSCEQSDLGSRAQQCATVDDRRRSAQTIAIIGYATGGALLTASVVSYLLGSDRGYEAEPPDRGPALACGLSPHAWGLSCNGAW